MRVGDIEYTQEVSVITDTLQESEFVDLNFATGIKVRPLLTFVGAFYTTAQAITGGQSAFLENGQSVPADSSRNTLEADGRLLHLHSVDFALATNGMGIIAPFQTTWWKILMPQIRLHNVATTLAVSEVHLTLHYRWAELTDDEIVEIAAQRSTN